MRCWETLSLCLLGMLLVSPPFGCRVGIENVEAGCPFMVGGASMEPWDWNYDSPLPPGHAELLSQDDSSESSPTAYVTFNKAENVSDLVKSKARDLIEQRGPWEQRDRTLGSLYRFQTSIPRGRDRTAEVSQGKQRDEWHRKASSPLCRRRAGQVAPTWHPEMGGYNRTDQLLDDVSPREWLEQVDQRDPHHLQGHISIEYGFLPPKGMRPWERAPLPSKFRIWETLSQSLPSRCLTGGIRSSIGESVRALEAAAASLDELEDQHLISAYITLSVLSHAYFRCADGAAVQRAPDLADLPKALLWPYYELGQRMGKAPYSPLSFTDMMLNNWRVDPTLKRPHKVRAYHVGKTVPWIPVYNNSAEKIHIGIFIEVEKQFAPAIAEVVSLVEKLPSDEAKDIESIKRSMAKLHKVVLNLVQSFRKFSQMAKSDTFVDATEWGRTYASFTNPVPNSLYPHGRGAGGLQAAFPHLLDVLLGREEFDSFLGQMHLVERDWLPLNVHQFIHSIQKTMERTISLREKVRTSGDTEMIGLYNSIVNAYAGPKGLLFAHQIKAWGFLEQTVNFGRSSTTGHTVASVASDCPPFDPLESNVQELRESREERLALTMLQTSKEYTSRPWPTFAKVSDVRLVTKPPANPFHKSALSPILKAVRQLRLKMDQLSDILVKSATRENAEHLPVRKVTLDLEGSGLLYQPGDRVRVLPRNYNLLSAKTAATLFNLLGLSPKTSPQQFLKFLQQPIRIGQSREWREFASGSLIEGESVPGVVPLSTFLEHATLRPLTPSILENFAKLVDFSKIINPSPILERLLKKQYGSLAASPGNFEFWDLVQATCQASLNSTLIEFPFEADHLVDKDDPAEMLAAHKKQGFRDFPVVEHVAQNSVVKRRHRTYGGRHLGLKRESSPDPKPDSKGESRPNSKSPERGGLSRRSHSLVFHARGKVEVGVGQSDRRQLTRTPSASRTLKSVINAMGSTQATARILDALNDSASQEEEVAQAWACPALNVKSFISQLSDLLPPLQPRQYSVSSFQKNDDGKRPTSVSMTVGPLKSFGSRLTRTAILQKSLTAAQLSQSEAMRLFQETRQSGVCSSFLRTASQGSVVALDIVRPALFELPQEHAGLFAPIHMFGTKTGIAPFMSFLDARSKIKRHTDGSTSAFENHLYLKVAYERDIPYRQELERYLADGVLASLTVIVSREEKVCGVRGSPLSPTQERAYVFGCDPYEAPRRAVFTVFLYKAVVNKVVNKYGKNYYDVTIRRRARSLRKPERQLTPVRDLRMGCESIDKNSVKMIDSFGMPTLDATRKIELLCEENLQRGRFVYVGCSRTYREAFVKAEVTERLKERGEWWLTLKFDQRLSKLEGCDNGMRVQEKEAHYIPQWSFSGRVGQYGFTGGRSVLVPPGTQVFVPVREKTRRIRSQMLSYLDSLDHVQCEVQITGECLIRDWHNRLSSNQFKQIALDAIHHKFERHSSTLPPAHFYVCGRGYMNTMVRQFLLSALKPDHFEGFAEWKAKYVAENIRHPRYRWGADTFGELYIEQMAAEGRLDSDTFTSANQDGGRRSLGYSEVARKSLGTYCYVIIHHSVYELSTYMHMHPGGEFTLSEKCGTDATNAFEAVHYGVETSEITGILSAYYVSGLKLPNFHFDVGESDEPVSMADKFCWECESVYASWVEVARIITVRKNMFENDLLSGEKFSSHTHISTICDRRSVEVGVVLDRYEAAYLGEIREALARLQDSHKHIKKPHKLPKTCSFQGLTCQETLVNIHSFHHAMWTLVTMSLEHIEQHGAQTSAHVLERHLLALFSQFQFGCAPQSNEIEVAQAKAMERLFNDAAGDNDDSEDEFDPNVRLEQSDAIVVDSNDLE